VNNGIAEVTTDGAFTEFTDPNPGALPVSIATGADGNLFFTDQNRNAIVRFLDDGLPRPPFQPVATYVTDVSPFTVQTADLRGNGTLDLVTGNEAHVVPGGTQVRGSVSVLLGNGDGTFQTHVDYQAGFSPRAVAIGDFTGNGIPDLVVAVRAFSAARAAGCGTCGATAMAPSSWLRTSCSARTSSTWWRGTSAALATSTSSSRPARESRSCA
jgi:hypothetical protein